MFTKFFKKSRITLITILSLLSITSVGFASWTIAAFDVEQKVSGSLESDIVIDSKNYLYLDSTKGDTIDSDLKSGFTCFEYSDYGYLDEEGNNVDTGFIYQYYVLDIKSSYELFKNDFSTLEVVLKMEYSEDVSTKLNIFKYNITGNGSHDLSSEIYEISSDSVNVQLNEVDINNISKEYKIKLTFNQIISKYGDTTDDIEIPDKLFFTIKYSFKATAGNYFKDNIFEYLYKDNIDVACFKTTVYMYGINS